MRTIDRYRRSSISANPAAYARQVTGHDLQKLERHFDTASRLLSGGQLSTQDVAWLDQLAAQSRIPAQWVRERVQEIKSEPNPQRRAELYIAGVQGSPESARVGLQMTAAFERQRTVNALNKRLTENKPRSLQDEVPIDESWKKRYAEERSDEDSRRDAIVKAIQEQVGYTPPEKMTLEQRQANAQHKANALADAIEHSAGKPVTLREQIAQNVHADSVLEELHDLGLREESDTFSAKAEQWGKSEQVSAWRADE